MWSLCVLHEQEVADKERLIKDKESSESFLKQLLAKVRYVFCCCNSGVGTWLSERYHAACAVH